MSVPEANETPAPSEVERQHSKLHITAVSGEKSGYQRTTHPEAQWYPQVGLGMFFHWGISSVLGQGDLSWSMMRGEPGYATRQSENYGFYAVQSRISPAAYWKQAEHFLCEDYEPLKWLKAAKEVGVEYVVLTTKHHDGFCLWPSEYGELSTRNFLNGRDLVGEFVEACRELGLRIGFYYSPPDWHVTRDYTNFDYGNAYPGLDQHFQPRRPEDFDAPMPEWVLERHRNVVDGHIRELLTRYGKVDLLWFDGRVPQGGMSIEDVRRIQPGIIVNTRGHGVGDISTPECRFPPERLDPGWWEYCHVFADGAWGYLDHETYKPVGWLLSELAKTRSWDGTFLPNVAPDSQGRMPATFYLRMRQLKDWMAHSGESVRGTTGGGWPEDSNVPLTHRPGKTYAHLDWLFDPHDAVEIRGLKAAPHSVTMLRTDQKVEHTYRGGCLRFMAPVDALTNLTDVVLITHDR